MPGGDGTGPRGTWNNCMPRNYGRRRFWRRGAGFGGFWSRTLPTRDEEIQSLKEEKGFLEQEINELKRRMEELEK